MNLLQKVFQPSEKTAKRWVPPLFRRFGREERGVAAIEMSFVLLPLTFMFGSIFELSMQSFANSIMRTGTAEFARLLRTNQIDNNFSIDEAREIICRSSFPIFDCSEMAIDVQMIASWGSPGIPTNAQGGLDRSGMGMGQGGRTSINVVRAYYEWDGIIPQFMSFGHGATTPDGSKFLVATEAFRIEP